MKSSRLLQLNRKTILLLSAMIGATCAVVFFQYIFGNKVLAFYDIGSDTMQQYLSQYATIIRKIRTGDWSLWDADNGFGVNMNMLNMTNPALILIYIFGAIFGTEAFPYALIYLYILEIFLAGLSCYFFLSAFSFGERAKCLAAYMYAFSGFLMVWGQHYQFAIVPTLLMLELLMIERCIRCREKWPALTVMTFVLVFNSMYIAYMTLIFCAVYVLLRIFMRPLVSFKRYVLDVFRLAFALGLGTGLGFITLLPSVSAILSVSSRLSTNESLFQRLFGYSYSKAYYSVLFHRLFSQTARGITDYKGFLNYYEDPCFFFSTLFIFLGVQYLFLIPGMKIKFRVKILQYAVFAAVTGAVLSTTAGTLLNGLTAPFSRYMFLCMAYFALISAVTLDLIFKEKRLNYPALILTLLLVVIEYGRSFFSAGIPNPKWVSAAHLTGGTAMAAVLVALAGRKTRQYVKPLAAVLAFLLFCNVSADALSSFYNRDAVLKGGEYFKTMYDADTEAALKYISASDGEYFRTEKTYGTTMTMDSLVQGYHPVSTYNSTQNANIQNYVRTFWPDLLYNDLNHYLYVLGCMNEKESDLTGIKYVLSRTDQAGIPGFEILKKFGAVTLYRNEDVENIASYYDESKVSGTYGIASDGYTKTVEVSYGERDQEAQVKLSDTGRDDRIAGSIEADRDGILFLAIPYEHGWSVRIDGVPAERLKADEGFTAVHVSAGNHKIEINYLCPGLIKGAVISGFSFLLFGLLVIVEKRKKRRSEKVASNSV